jgi:phospholipid/cholesterol/gamma-HCH transport system substrate-binding protein
MENKAHALAAGLFVALMAALLLAMAAWLTRDSGPRERYEIATREAVTGLAEQAPVRYRGVDVGKVTRIGFDPRQPGQVLVQLDVRQDTPVTTETYATLSFQGVTGLAFVQLDDSGQAGRPVQGDADAPPRIPLRPGLLSQLTDKGTAILGQVEQISTRLNQLLDEGNQRRVAGAVENIARAADQVASLSRNLDTTLTAQFGPQRVDIPSLVRRTDSALAALEGTAQEARGAIAEIGVTARRLNAPDGPIDRLAEGTQALSHAADAFNAATLPRINRATEDTSRAVRQLSRTVNNINDNPQSLIFGSGRIDPGPGEPGFVAPGAGSQP